MHINGKDNSSVEHQGESEPLYHHRSHLFIDAVAFDIDHQEHHHWVQYIQTTWLLQRAVHPPQQQ